MAKISTYAIDDIPTLNDKVIGTETDNSLITKNYKLSDIIALVPGGKLSVQSLNTLTGELTLVGAGGISISSTGTTITLTGSGGITSIAADNDVDPPGAIGPAIILKGTNGISVTRAKDSNVLSIIGSAGNFVSLTTVGQEGAATLISGVLNIPNYTVTGFVTDVSGVSPIVSSGGTSPDISIGKSTAETDGYLGSTDFTNFNSKQSALVSGTTIKTINNTSLLGSGNITIDSGEGVVKGLTTNNTSGVSTLNGDTGILNIPNYSTSASGVDGSVQYSASSAFSSSATLNYNASTYVLKVGDNASSYAGTVRVESNNSTVGGKLELQTGIGKGASEIVGILAPPSGVSVDIILPASLPVQDQVLTATDITSGVATTSWTTLQPTGYTSPDGSVWKLQVNNEGIISSTKVS